MDNEILKDSRTVTNSSLRVVGCFLVSSQSAAALLRSHKDGWTSACEDASEIMSANDTVEIQIDSIVE